MDIFENIMSRRSVRDWEDKPVPDEMVKKLLAAAMQAPSARNQQAWQFIVLNQREVLDQVAQTSPGAGWATKAPLGIIVCGDMSIQSAMAGYWVQDCSAASLNILLAAQALGLGGVWTGGYPNMDRANGLAKVVGLPDTVIPLSMVLIGYPKSRPEPEDRFKEDRVHYNQW
ncbi:MAG: nitroreductase family protein [Desulfobacteraceae bacterium]|nr:nitroreductase family protein [Desulfobacteraceae bacterium]MBU4055013.1 nitroreductase family protein [Pseudomonadota bacterium]